VAELQFKRWSWATGHQWTYVNTLRIQKFSDANIQSMCDGVRPLCFSGEEIHKEFCTTLGNLGRALEKEMGWKNVRFVQTGSSVVGFSTNPLKGVAERPTKITSLDKSDVDVVIVAEGLNEWIVKSRTEKKPFIGRDFPTTRCIDKYGNRAACRKPEDVCEPLKEWVAVWSKKLDGGVQITFDTEANPTIPPWESWVPIHKYPLY